MDSHLGSSHLWHGISLLLLLLLPLQSCLSASITGRCWRFFQPALLDFAQAPVAGRRCLDNKRIRQRWPCIITPVPLPSCAPPPLAWHEFPTFMVFPESFVQPDRVFWDIHAAFTPSPCPAQAGGVLWDFWYPLDGDWAWLCLGICRIPFPDGIYSAAFSSPGYFCLPCCCLQRENPGLKGRFTSKCIWGGNKSKVAVQRFPRCGRNPWSCWSGQ